MIFATSVPFQPTSGSQIAQNLGDRAGHFHRPSTMATAPNVLDPEIWRTAQEFAPRCCEPSKPRKRLAERRLLRDGRQRETCQPSKKQSTNVLNSLAWLTDLLRPDTPEITRAAVRRWSIHKPVEFGGILADDFLAGGFG